MSDKSPRLSLASFLTLLRAFNLNDDPFELYFGIPQSLHLPQVSYVPSLSARERAKVWHSLGLFRLVDVHESSNSLHGIIRLFHYDDFIHATSDDDLNELAIEGEVSDEFGLEVDFDQLSITEEHEELARTSTTNSDVSYSDGQFSTADGVTIEEEIESDSGPRWDIMVVQPAHELSPLVEALLLELDSFGRLADDEEDYLLSDIYITFRDALSPDCR